MNKLDKIKGESMGEIEEFEENCEKVAEESEKKNFFSIFTFWRRANSDLVEEERVDTDETTEKKGIMKYLNIKTGAIAAALLLIVAAGYINVKYSGDAIGEREAVGALDGINEALLEGGAGTSDETDDYFAMSVINRQRVRDEALEILLDLTESEVANADAKADAYNEMTRMANEITNEANIESLIKAKGFSNCVAVVSGDDVNVVVESDGLTVNQVAQIKEIVYLECGAHPDNIKIIEKSSV